MGVDRALAHAARVNAASMIKLNDAIRFMFSSPFQAIGVGKTPNGFGYGRKTNRICKEFPLSIYHFSCINFHP
jgi:hypothetical protein